MGPRTRAASSATPTPWAGSRAATPSTSGCRSPTSARSPSPRGSTTSARCSPPTGVPTGWMGARPRRGPARRRGRGVGRRRRSGRWRPAAAMLLGAERVIVIDRLTRAPGHGRARTSAPRPSTTAPTDVGAELRERTGGRGPDVCIEAVGMEAHTHRPAVSATTRSSSSCACRPTGPTAVREAINACRKGGSVFVLGVFAGLVDKFPLGRADEQGPDRCAARSSTGSGTSRCCWTGSRKGELAHRAPGHPRHAAGRGARRATTCSRTRRTAASAPSSTRAADRPRWVTRRQPGLTRRSRVRPSGGGPRT